MGRCERRGGPGWVGGGHLGRDEAGSIDERRDAACDEGDGLEDGEDEAWDGREERGHDDVGSVGQSVLLLY